MTKRNKIRNLASGVENKSQPVEVQLTEIRSAVSKRGLMLVGSVDGFWSSQSENGKEVAIGPFQLLLALINGLTLFYSENVLLWNHGSFVKSHTKFTTEMYFYCSTKGANKLHNINMFPMNILSASPILQWKHISIVITGETYKIFNENMLLHIKSKTPLFISLGILSRKINCRNK